MPRRSRCRRLRTGRRCVRRITNTGMSPLTGTFENGEEALVFRPSGGSAGNQPGYHVLTPLRLKSGGTVIVNRGFVPLERKQQNSRQAGLNRRRNNGNRSDAPTGNAQFLYPCGRSGGWKLFHPRPRLDRTAFWFGQYAHPSVSMPTRAPFRAAGQKAARPSATSPTTIIPMP